MCISIYIYTLYIRCMYTNVRYIYMFTNTTEITMRPAALENYIMRPPVQKSFPCLA